MTYLKYPSRAGSSTTPVSARIQTRYIERCKEKGWKLNKLVNVAVANLMHDFQTDHLPDHHADYLKMKEPWGIPEGRFIQPTTAVSIRLRTDLYEYMNMNLINRNCAINYALERWYKRLADGCDIDCDLIQLQR